MEMVGLRMRAGVSVCVLRCVPFDLVCAGFLIELSALAFICAPLCLAKRLLVYVGAGEVSYISVCLQPSELQLPCSQPQVCTPKNFKRLRCKVIFTSLPQHFPYLFLCALGWRIRPV